MSERPDCLTSPFGSKQTTHEIEIGLTRGSSAEMKINRLLQLWNKVKAIRLLCHVHRQSGVAFEMKIKEKTKL